MINSNLPVVPNPQYTFVPKQEARDSFSHAPTARPGTQPPPTGRKWLAASGLKSLFLRSLLAA